MARANRRAGAHRSIREAVLQATGIDGILLLRLAQAAAETAAGTFRVGGEGRVAGAVNRDESGTGADKRRAVADRGRGGRGDATYGIGSTAGMIHLPASVRVYLCLTACDM